MATHSHDPISLVQCVEDEANGAVNEPGLRHVHEEAGKRGGSR